MTILKNISILIFSSSLLLLPLLAPARDSVGEQDLDPEIESKLATEQDDTFSIIAEREFGHVEIGIALAGYNQLPFTTVFSSQQEVLYPNRFAAKPDSVEVCYFKGDVRYLSGGNAYSTGQVVKGDIFGPADVIEASAAGFVSLGLPSGDFINVTPGRRFKLDQLRCLPDDANCAVLIDEDYGRIYLNIKGRDGHPVRFKAARSYYPSAYWPAFDFQMAVAPTGRDWPVRTQRSDLFLAPPGSGGIPVNINNGRLEQLEKLFDGIGQQLKP